MIWIRTVLFMIVFYGLSVPIVLLTPVTALFGRNALIVHTHIWTKFHGWATEHILGIHRRVEGEMFASGPVIYAAKHQAMYETLELGRLLQTPAIVMKQELASIPSGAGRHDAMASSSSIGRPRPARSGAWCERARPSWRWGVRS